MSSEIEAAGAMVTAGLAARAIDGADGNAIRGDHTAEAHAHARCANCDTALAGAYCHACGQPSHVHRSMLHIVEEFFHGVLHFDSKAWRTLPMLVFKPGKLTRDYIQGHRVRYVSPLALFLFTAFLMFLTFSLLGGGVDATLPPAEARADARTSMAQTVEEARADLAKAEKELAAAMSAGSNTLGEQVARDVAQQILQKSEAALTAYDGVAATAPAGVAASPAAPERPSGTGIIQAIADYARSPAYNIDLGSPELTAKVRKKLEDPEFLIYKLQNTAYKFSWLLIPISLPFLWLLFAWKRDVAMYDHVIFSLYSLSFMSLLFITASLLAKAGDGMGTVVSWLLLAPVIHMFAHLKGTYALSTGSALWRTVALLFITMTTSTIFIGVIVMMGFM